MELQVIASCFLHVCYKLASPFGYGLHELVMACIHFDRAQIFVQVNVSYMYNSLATQHKSTCRQVGFSIVFLKRGSRARLHGNGFFATCIYSETCIKQTPILGGHSLLSGHQLKSLNFLPMFPLKQTCI